MAQTHQGALPLPTSAVRGISASGAQRLAGLLLFLLAAQFMTVIMLGASIAPGYDYASAAISDLGVIVETALLFNASLLVIAALNVVGGYLFYCAHANRWLLSAFVLGAVGAAGAGVVPLDRSGLHGIFALVAFVFFNVEAIGTGLVIRGPMRAISIVAGAVGLAFVVLMVIGDAGNPAVFGPIGHGGAERMIVYPAMLWLMGFGGYLMGRHSNRDRRDAVPPRPVQRTQRAPRSAPRDGMGGAALGNGPLSTRARRSQQVD